MLLHTFSVAVLQLKSGDEIVHQLARVWSSNHTLITLARLFPPLFDLLKKCLVFCYDDLLV